MANRNKICFTSVFSFLPHKIKIKSVLLQSFLLFHIHFNIHQPWRDVDACLTLIGFLKNPEKLAEGQQPCSARLTLWDIGAAAFPPAVVSPGCVLQVISPWLIASLSSRLWSLSTPKRRPPTHPHTHTHTSQREREREKREREREREREQASKFQLKIFWGERERERERERQRQRQRQRQRESELVNSNLKIFWREEVRTATVGSWPRLFLSCAFSSFSLLVSCCVSSLPSSVTGHPFVPALYCDLW